MARTTLPPPQFVKCDNCGHDRSEHHSANLTDGAFVGKYLLICPTVVFRHKGHDVDGIAFRDKAMVTRPRRRARHKHHE